MAQFELRLDRSALDGMIERKFVQACLELGGEFTKQISSPKWDWPSGESPRDIVKTGRLRASQTGRLVGRLQYEYTWPVNYSIGVLLGSAVEGAEGGVRVIPGRDWISAGLQEFDFINVMARTA